MKSLKFPILFLFLIYFYSLQPYSQSQAMQVIDWVPNSYRGATLQIAFVLDRTAHRYFYNRIGTIIPVLFERFHFRSKIELAFTTFKDYAEPRPKAEGNGEHFSWLDKRVEGIQAHKNKKYKDGENCYAVETRFWQSNYVIQVPSAEKVRLEPNKYGAEGKENSIQAVFLTAADTELGWLNDDDTSKKGKPLRKYIILLTDNDFLSGNASSDPNPHNRSLYPRVTRPPRGDGTDTCQNAGLAQVEDLRNILAKKRIKLIVGVSRTPRWCSVDLMKNYKTFLDQLKLPYELFQFDQGNPNDLAKEINSKIAALFDKGFEQEGSNSTKKEKRI